MIDQGKHDTELEYKFNSLKLMYEKDNEKSKKMDPTQIEDKDQISTLPYEGARQSEITQSPELRKRDIDSLITILKGFQKIYPLMEEIKIRKQ